MMRTRRKQIQVNGERIENTDQLLDAVMRVAKGRDAAQLKVHRSARAIAQGFTPCDCCGFAIKGESTRIVGNTVGDDCCANKLRRAGYAW